MTSHICINGRTIEYRASGEEESFLALIAEACGDDSRSDADVRALIYDPTNPLFNQRAGYSFVTADAFENPVFRVALDLLDRRRIRLGTLDMEGAAARYTMSVSQAAEQLGIRDSAVRTAVLEHRLPSWKKNGQIFLDPASVASYQVSRRGRAPQLRVKCGGDERASLEIRVVGGALTVVEENGCVVNGTIDRWARVYALGVVRSSSSSHISKNDSQECWILEPGGTEQQVVVESFVVAGRFTIVRHEVGGAAEEAWAAAGRVVVEGHREAVSGR